MKLEDIKIGGHTVPTLLGANQYQGPMGAYMELLGLTEGPAENEPMRWGTAAEHVVARRYAKETGAVLLPSIDEGYDRLKPFVHPQYSWWTGTPDRLVEPDGGLEIKIVGERSAHQWTEEEVPDMYFIQCHWYMGLFPDRTFWDLAVQIGNRDYRVYRINRDEEMLETLRIAAEDFINNHLIPESPPTIDASESSKKYLNHTYPQDKGEMLPTTPDAERWAEQLALANQQLKHWESIKTLNENLLKNIIGDAKGIQSGNWKATWTLNKPSQKTDWQAAFERLRESYISSQNSEHDRKLAQDWADDIKDEHTTIKPGARVFRPYLKALIEEED